MYTNKRAAVSCCRRDRQRDSGGRLNRWNELGRKREGRTRKRRGHGGKREKEAVATIKTKAWAVHLAYRLQRTYEERRRLTTCLKEGGLSSFRRSRHRVTTKRAAAVAAPSSSLQNGANPASPSPAYSGEVVLYGEAGGNNLDMANLWRGGFLATTLNVRCRQQRQPLLTSYERFAVESACSCAMLR